jgi:hypothetical protein
MPLLKFHLPVENAPGTPEVKIEVNDNQVMVLGYFEHIAKCPGYYYGAVVTALLDLGGSCTEEQPEYAQSPWAEWCKLNGEPFPSRWSVRWWIAKQFLGFIFAIPVWIILTLFPSLSRHESK